MRGYALINDNNFISTSAQSIVESTGNPATGAISPTKTFLGTVVGYKFAVSDELYFNFLYPPGIKQGANLLIHLHCYSSNTTAARYVRFQADYTIVKNGDDVTTGSASGTLNTGDVLLPTAANTLFEPAMSVAVPVISVTDDPHFFIKISRIASVGTAPTAGDNPVVAHMEFEYTIDQIGN